MNIRAKTMFDKRDHELIRIVNSIRDSSARKDIARKWYYPVFHPNGIREMTETKGLRIAYAVAHLLNSLEVGAMENRIIALQLLRLEVLDNTRGPMPKNTARVLLQLMKELVRAQGNYHRQLTLAHDFRMAAFGKPLAIRRHLKQFRLLEMPEEWNQVTFDDHVHDVNTKGRKTPTHLVMDAWIKGIRRLRVIHYSYIEPRFAAELFSAAKIMEIDVRIGVEYNALYRGKYIQLTWVPRGFADTQDYLCFLAEPSVMRMMEKGKAVSSYQQQYVMALLEKFNARYLEQINDRFGITIPPVQESDFLKFVGIGQKSIAHLTEYIQIQAITAVKTKMTGHQEQKKENLRAAENKDIPGLDVWEIEQIIESYLKPEKNPEIAYPGVYRKDADVPELLTYSAPDIINLLTRLRSGYRITLNLSTLTVDEVLELLYDCQGGITRLEIFNLKDYVEGNTDHLAAISHLQQTINNGSIITLKQVVRNILAKVEAAGLSDAADRVSKLSTILNDLPGLKLFYKETPLKSRIGSDSTGRTFNSYGMGLAVKETLSLGAQREIHWQQADHIRKLLPLRMTVYPKKTYVPYEKDAPLHPLVYRFALMAPFLHWIGFVRKFSWEVESASTRMHDRGNIVTLGGMRKEEKLASPEASTERDPSRPRFGLRHMNTRLKISSKW